MDDRQPDAERRLGGNESKAGRKRISNDCLPLLSPINFINGSNKILWDETPTKIDKILWDDNVV